MTTETRAEIKAQIADLQAKLAAMDADPLLIEAEALAFQYANGPWRAHDLALAALRRGMELRPPRSPMTDAEVEELAAEVADDWHYNPEDAEPLRDQPEWREARDIALQAIRETLRRAPVQWPGEISDLIHSSMDKDFKRVETLSEPEWIDWHGGECPVPAGTWVEVRLRAGVTDIDAADNYSWWQTGGAAPWHVIAYRILGEQS